MIAESAIAQFWDQAEPEIQEQIALSAGVQRGNLDSFGPLFTWWRYCNKRSKNRLQPVIEKILDKSGYETNRESDQALRIKNQIKCYQVA